jgi:hypothetical protein
MWAGFDRRFLLQWILEWWQILKMRGISPSTGFLIGSSLSRKMKVELQLSSRAVEMPM